MRRVDARFAVVVLVLAAPVVVGGPYYLKALRRLDARADANSSLSISDRRVAGGNAIVVDQAAAFEADALIPAHAAFRVIVGPGLRRVTPLTRLHVESWFRYFLLPRRPSASAHWIICYGCDTRELRGYEARWRDAIGISIGRTQ